MKIIQTTCNGINNPLGFAMNEARLSWMMEAEGHNHVQTAFEVEARWNEECYQSGKIKAARASNGRCRWRLRP